MGMMIVGPLHWLMVTVTDVGDSAVLGAAVLSGAACLAWMGNRKAAFILLYSLFAAGAAIGVLKVVFIGCNLNFFDFNIRTPSGHAALSAAVLGTIGVLMATRLAGWVRVGLFAAIILLVAGIAVTRVLLHAHTSDEVVVGLLVGTAVAIGAQFLVWRSGMAPVRLRGIGATTLAAIILLNGVRLPAEDAVRWLALLVHTHTDACAVVHLPIVPPASHDLAKA